MAETPSPAHPLLGPAGDPRGRPAGHRYAKLLVALGVAAILVAAGFLIARWRTRAESSAVPMAGAKQPGPTRLAVLPFQNLGDTSTAYFADGIADEIRGKLATLPQLLVIARSSSALYRQSGKPLPAITRELDVEYVLTAAVQWIKDPGGANHVQVRPELVRVVGNTAVTQWQQSFDAVVTDVFQVQGQIAARVAQALDLQFGAEQRSKLAEQPTKSLPAYDAFLRGEEVWTAATSGTVGLTGLVPASHHFQRAVTLDPEFLAAWVRLAQTQAIIFGNRPSEARRAGISAAAVRHAAERASALAGRGSEGNLALGYYYGLVEHDDARALEQFNLGLRVSPNDPDLLIAASLAEQTLGRWDDALAHSRRAALVDPRAVDVVVGLGHVLLQTRRYDEAGDVFARARALEPNDVNVLQGSVLTELASGDLAAARALLDAPGVTIDSAAVAAALASRNVGWALADPLRRVLEQLGPAAFGGDRIAWALALADAAAMRGDSARARAFSDSARGEAGSALERAPNDAYIHAGYGIALARLGRRDAAIRESKRALELMPTAKYAADGPYLQHQLVRVYLLVGDYDSALDQLEPLLETPYYLSPGWLRIDPAFAPLRGNPRFERLARGE